MHPTALISAAQLIDAPLVHKGKVRELFDLGEHYLIVVTDRISAFDFVLEPAVPGKGIMLNLLSRFWFDKTAPLQANHLLHCDIGKLGGIIKDPALLQDRIMVVRKAERIAVECVVRGYITGGAWRQYQQTGAVNGVTLAAGLRKNERLAAPLFTPALKRDSGHDEDITLAQLDAELGTALSRQLQARSLELYRFMQAECAQKGIMLADTKLEFGMVGGDIILIDELGTPDSSRFWAQDTYQLGSDIDSLDKEPVRSYLAHSSWNRQDRPDPLPAHVIEATRARYRKIYQRLTQP